MAHGIAPTVGADAYPKGTGSGSRSYLAGRHWRPAARPYTAPVCFYDLTAAPS